MAKSIDTLTHRALVITTINRPGPIVRAMAKGAKGHKMDFLIIGDRKTPSDFSVSFGEYFDLEAQAAECGKFAQLLPICHYSRKNLGYLIAAERGALEIQETDDDNLPTGRFWQTRTEPRAIAAVSHKPWLNVYELFSNRGVWPRGLPLEHLSNSTPRILSKRRTRMLIVQGLADDNPDVDAVYRLTRRLPIRFQRGLEYVVEPGSWCPFNSQNTIFKRDAFPLLYLPSHCSFRMTDIWRSFVAQRCLWEVGEGVVFHSATVVQTRNEHDLLKDFEQEVPGYLYNDKIRRVLEATKIDGRDFCGSLVRCYETLVKSSVLPAVELTIVRKWAQVIGAVLR